MRVICLAYHSVGHMGLSFFLDETDDQLVAVFTHEDAPGEEVWWPSVADLARDRGVPVHAPQDINAPQVVALIRSLRPDFIFSFWYRHLVRPEILDIPPGGCLNLHGSLLPRYRGRAPVNWVLVNGEEKTGMTLHYMVPRADAGDIVGQAMVPIDTADTASTLYAKLVDAGREVLRVCWPLLRDGQAPRLPQDDNQATYVGRRTPEDGRFDWEWPAQRIHNLVRAVTHPYPGAFTEFRGRRLYVWHAAPAAGVLYPNPPTPGTVLYIGNGMLRIATGEGSLDIHRLQLADACELSGEEFAARHALQVGQLLGGRQL